MALVTIVFLSSLYLFLSANATLTSLNSVLFNDNYEFIDLSYPFDNNSIYWPGNRKFEFTKVKEEFVNEDTWYIAKEFTAAEHGGTHLDAPSHFAINGQFVEEIPLEKLIVPLIIVDISSKVNDNSSFVLYKHDLDYLLNDNMGKPCLVVFKFGWSKFYNDPTKYLGIDVQSNLLHFPGLSGEVAEWITGAYKNVVGIGVDVASVDPGPSTDYPVHKITSNAGLYSLENVNLSQPIPDHGCTALVMPMKIARGSGAPLRLVAICPKQIPNAF